MNDKWKTDVALFCTGDKKYIPMMIASLGMTAIKNPFDPWIITDAADKETKDLLDKSKIGYIQQDLHEYFDSKDINKIWPSQSFWWSSGPETFYDLGYKYSIFIDADIYCNKMIDMSKFNDDLEMAACSYSEKVYNSGVILFNNEKMKEKRLWQSFLNCYRGLSTKLFQSWHGGKVHDQQVLTALDPESEFGDFLGKPYTFEIENLDVLWNYDWKEREGVNDQHIRKPYEKLKQEVYFAHFANSKPWFGLSGWGSKHHGLFKNEEHPHGWPEKEKTEPVPLNRLKFVEDWRRELRIIEKERDIKLFDEFESLDEICSFYEKRDILI
jgi:hypothetical protein